MVDRRLTHLPGGIRTTLRRFLRSRLAQRTSRLPRVMRMERIARTARTSRFRRTSPFSRRSRVRRTSRGSRGSRIQRTSRGSRTSRIQRTSRGSRTSRDSHTSRFVSAPRYTRTSRPLALWSHLAVSANSVRAAHTRDLRASRAGRRAAEGGSSAAPRGLSTHLSILPIGHLLSPPTNAPASHLLSPPARPGAQASSTLNRTQLHR